VGFACAIQLLADRRVQILQAHPWGELSAAGWQEIPACTALTHIGQRTVLGCSHAFATLALFAHPVSARSILAPSAHMGYNQDDSSETPCKLAKVANE